MAIIRQTLFFLFVYHLLSICFNQSEEWSVESKKE